MSGVATGIIAVGTAVFGGIQAGKARREAERLRRRQERKITALEATRQEIPDFLAGGIENPYANLQIATRASEMQAEQQDISLASTLDTLRATGASAGGATALARAASQSKRGVAAQIEQQEARNAQLRAQGEMQATQIRQRGQQIQYEAQEKREMQQLNRASSLASSASQQAAAYKVQQSQAIGQAVGALGSFAAAGGFGKSGPFAANPAKSEMRFQQKLEKVIDPGEFNLIDEGVIKPIQEPEINISDINVIEPPDDLYGKDYSSQNPFAGLNLRFDPAAQARTQQQQMGYDFMGSLGMHYNPYGIKIR